MGSNKDYFDFDFDFDPSTILQKILKICRQKLKMKFLDIFSIWQGTMS